MSRKIEDLNPRAQQKCNLFLFKVREGTIHEVMITSTRRTQEEQNALYAQGRTTPGKIVTWTRNSRHISGDAFDIAILKQGKIVWDTKVDVDADGIPDYKELGKIGESCGLTWGGRWKTPDYPHLEDNRQELEVS